MNSVELLVRMAKVIRTPEQAAVVLVIAGTIVAIAYFIPAESLE